MLLIDLYWATLRMQVERGSTTFVSNGSVQEIVVYSFVSLYYLIGYANSVLISFITASLTVWLHVIKCM